LHSIVDVPQNYGNGCPKVTPKEVGIMLIDVEVCSDIERDESVLK
jgi:hypothetical protein